jgi:hypothetical protein
MKTINKFTINATTPAPGKPRLCPLMALAAGLATLLAGTGVLQAQPINARRGPLDNDHRGRAGAPHAQTINVPNGSFESQSGVGYPFGVNIFIDSWQKAPKPAYFDYIEANYGFYWIQTAGAFVDTNPYGNHAGSQVGYILPYPQVALFQDYNTVDWNDASPTHDFNATFNVGRSYKLTIGVFAKNMTEGSSLQLSLYYRDSLDNPVTVASTIISYSAANFPVTTPLNLIDYEVIVPTVSAHDDWAGQNIGIKIEAINGDGNGNWDFDNVRLTSVPGRSFPACRR